MPNGIWWWTNGFWPGLLWQAYHATGNEKYRTAALKAGQRLQDTLLQPEQLDHDTGFLFQPSAVAQFRLTGDSDARAAAIQAAGLLERRLNEQGGFLRAWDKSPWMEDSSGLMIIDCMMNLPLLFWASTETSDSHYSETAVHHAETSLRYLLRPDGSCAHIASFHPLTGEFLGTLGGQGYGEGSAWSRGQGWAVYGFALAYLPALVYTPGPRMAFHIPAPELRSCYSPKCFSGSCHLIRARAAKPKEISARRNLAFNPTIMYGRLAASRTSFPVSKRRARISLPETPWTAFLKTIPTAAGHIRHGASTRIPVQR